MRGSADITVVVATPSARLRARIRAALNGSPHITVVAETADGHRLADTCARWRPSVLLIDPALSPVTGPHLIHQVMKRCPTPILVISTGGTAPDAVAACLNAGAVDVCHVPDSGWEQDIRRRHRELVAAVTVVSRIRVVTQHSPRPLIVVDEAATVSDWNQPESSRPGQCELIAIGASTGGPAAITAVLSALPRPPAVPILLVLHVSQSFHPGLTRWLQDATGQRVRVAEAGAALSSMAGWVIAAPPGRHLQVRSGRLLLSTSPPRHSCRPSVDVLFDSIAAEVGGAASACLLTGMGRDGAAGLLAIRRAGGMTIAQDQATSVVYGMPAEAVRLGAAQFVLPLEQIGSALSGALAGRMTVPGQR